MNGYILLKDVQGIKKTTGAIRKMIQDHQNINILRGELMIAKQDDPSFNYQLWSEPSVIFYSMEDNVAPLSQDDFMLMEGIKKPIDRLEAFNGNKLELGNTLRVGSQVYIDLPGPNLAVVECARGVVHYKGRVGDLPGTLFGVEIMSERFRTGKYTDGTFQSKRYFQCADGCGLFVPLNKLSSEYIPGSAHPEALNDGEITSKLPKEKDGKPTYANAATKNTLTKNGTPAQSTRSKANESSVDSVPCQYQIGQYVMFHDKKGLPHYGTVKWTGRKEGVPYNIVGILTVDRAFHTDFAKSISGMELLLRSAPKNCALFLPEALVDLKGSDSKKRDDHGVEEINVTNIAKDLRVTNTELMNQQKEALGLAEKTKRERNSKSGLDRESVNAMQAVDESISNVSRQKEEYERLQAKAQEEKHHGSTGSLNIRDSSKNHLYEEVNTHPERHSSTSTQQNSEQLSYGVDHSQHAQHGVVDHRQHADDPHSVNQKQSYSYGVDQSNDYLHGQKYHAPQHQSDYQQGIDCRQQQYPPPASDTRQSTANSQYYNDSGRSHYSPNSASREQYNQQKNAPVYSNISGMGQSQVSSTSPGRHHRTVPSGHQDEASGQRHRNLHQMRSVNDIASSEYLRNGQQPHRPLSDDGVGQSDLYGDASRHQNLPPRRPDVLPIHEDRDERNAQPNEMLVFKAQTADVDPASMNLGVGSLIQIPSGDQDRLRYGTIKWIGPLPKVQGQIAGIELEEPMEGCTNGTWQQTGQKFFNCPDGMGIYYPLGSLRSDERYSDKVSLDGNPLKHVSEDVIETDVQPPNIDRYIGEEKGIQGHQNSCYLDATVFGLFALTVEFDDMFLRRAKDSKDVTGQILWKNIVNPLRKHGVVRYESVMKLREQLDRLGEMKGITQDEKDPEEFLNMMFKHTLKIPPFISIRRPFGVEEEYFVQLFLEIDEKSSKVPTVGDLLNKMFTEQQISFTKIPSKLLIQVPRFGKKFKMFQKIIPALYLNVATNVDLENTLKCFNCETVSKRVCYECTSDYRSAEESKFVPFCEECIKKVHDHSNRKAHKVEWCPEMANLVKLAELELLSVICIETSHYVCFTRQDDRWIFFDSMANRVYDQYNIPQVVDCTADLNKWVYPHNGDRSPLLDAAPRDLPEYVRRFTQDIYMCVYIQPDVGMYV